MKLLNKMLLLSVLLAFFSNSVFASEDKIEFKEYGVYIIGEVNSIIDDTTYVIDPENLANLAEIKNAELRIGEWKIYSIENNEHQVSIFYDENGKYLKVKVVIEEAPYELLQYMTKIIIYDKQLDLKYYDWAWNLVE